MKQASCLAVLFAFDTLKRGVRKAWAVGAFMENWREFRTLDSICRSCWRVKQLSVIRTKSATHGYMISSYLAARNMQAIQTS
eukprot:scaffold207_cov345-Pavlova_lutheri.AAC.42